MSDIDKDAGPSDNHGRLGLRGEGVPPLFFCVEGVSPSKRGQDARDTQGQDALATGRTRLEVSYDT